MTCSRASLTTPDADYQQPDEDAANVLYLLIFDILISDIHFNSKNTSTDSLFVAIKGVNHDGHNFISDAIDLGAISIVCEMPPEEIINNITYIIVNNSQIALGILASNFFNN